MRNVLRNSSVNLLPLGSAVTDSLFFILYLVSQNFFIPRYA